MNINKLQIKPIILFIVVEMIRSSMRNDYERTRKKTKKVMQCIAIFATTIIVFVRSLVFSPCLTRLVHPAKWVLQTVFFNAKQKKYFLSIRLNTLLILWTNCFYYCSKQMFDSFVISCGRISVRCVMCERKTRMRKRGKQRNCRLIDCFAIASLLHTPLAFHIN